MLLRPEARFELARQAQIGDAELGDVFAFCSGLYFRGKLTYARRFASLPADIQIITPSRGLMPAGSRVGLAELREFSTVPVASDEPRFTAPLQTAVRGLLARGATEIVLLGSIATGKYVETLLPILGPRLLFPSEFVGRGDMSRGGLLLRCAARGEELAYVSVAGAVRRGRRAQRVGEMK